MNKYCNGYTALHWGKGGLNHFCRGGKQVGRGALACASANQLGGLRKHVCKCEGKWVGTQTREHILSNKVIAQVSAPTNN